MKRRTIIFLLLNISSIFLTFQTKGEQNNKLISTKLNLIFQTASNLNRDEVFVQFNRTVLEEDSIIKAGETINFSVEIEKCLF